MAEAAGLVLGALPLAIWVLGKYAEPFDFLNKYRTAIESQKDILMLQNHLFRTSLAAIGLRDDCSEEELIRCLERKYPDISAHIISVTRRMDATMTEFLRDLDIDINADRDSLAGRVKWEWRRVKRSCNAKKHRNLIDDLRASNHDLRHVLESKPEFPAEDNSPQVLELKKRFSIERCDSIRQSLGSLHRTIESRLGCVCSTHQAAIALDWFNFETKAAKAFQLALSYKDGDQSVEPQNIWRRFHVTNTTVCEGLTDHRGLEKQTQSSSQPTRNWKKAPFVSKLEGLKDRHRVVRWSSSVQPSQSPSPGTTQSNTIIPSDPKIIGQKSQQKTESDIALCSAVFGKGSYRATSPEFAIRDPIPQDGDQVRHFSLKPDPAQASNSPINLRALSIPSVLSSTSILSSPPHGQSSKQTVQVDSMPQITLSSKQRYGIAASMAWSVLHLGGTSWLEYDNKTNSSRPLDSYTHVVFLERNDSGDERIMRHPCACYTFTSGKATSSLPPHTTTAKSRLVGDYSLIQNRTLFNLGILLIELAFDTPFSKLQDHYYKQKSSSSSAPEAAGLGLSGREEEKEVSDYAVARYWAQRLYTWIGDSYAYAAERCILCSFPGREDCRNFQNIEFRQVFYNDVVAPVVATYMMFPP